MIQLKTKPPRTKRTFANGWGELDYVCKKIRYWLYTRKQKARAERYLKRLAKVLRELPENDVAIIREEGLALLHELMGDLETAIAHREQEIHLTERLHQITQYSQQSKSTKAYVLQGRDQDALQERRAILKALKKQRTQNNCT